MEEEIVNIIDKANNKLKNKEFRVMEEKILALKNPELSYQFALRCKHANIKAHEKVILEKNSQRYVFLFAQNVKGANIKECEKVILEGKDLYYNYWYVKTISGANILAHSRKVLESKDALYNFLFMNILGADKEAHRKIIIESEYNLNLLYVDDKEHLNNIFNAEVESIIKHRNNTKTKHDI